MHEEPVSGHIEKKTNIIRASRVDEAWRLLAIHSPLQMTVTEGVLHVKLVDRLGT
jgi:hypothetical protein